jgi:hypothetical protein
MKKLVLLFFLLVSILSKAQNFQPLNSNSFQLFFQHSSFNISDWDSEGQNMWGTRVDLVDLEMNGDSVFYNYKIVRDTALENNGDMYNERCVWIYAPNWNGEKTIISTSGNSLFFNQSGDSILFQYAALIDSSWIAYTYENGTLLKATVDNILWTDDVWIQDSVKTISFQHIDSTGNSITDNINGKSIEIYQNHGFRKAFDFVKFPFDTISLFQLDVNYINKTEMLIDPLYGNFNNLPQVGDILSSHYHCSALMSQYPNWGGSESIKVLEVIPYPNNDTLRIKYLRNHSTSETNIEYNPFPPHPVTTTNFSSEEEYKIYYVDTSTVFASIFGDTLMPREHSAGGLLVPTIGNPSCFYPEIIINTCIWPISEFNVIQTDSCYLAPNPGKCNQGGYNYYVPYIGLTHTTYGSMNDGNDHSCTSFPISYIKSGNFECGNYWFVDVQDYEELKTELTLYPNPTSGNIVVKSELITKNTVLSVFNSLGQQVFVPLLEQTDNRVTLYTTHLAAGVYFLTLSNEGQTVNKKFVKE